MDNQVISDLDEVHVESLSVAACLVLVQALQEALIVVEDQVFERASLLFVQNAFLGHLGDHCEEHARFRPNLGRQHCCTSAVRRGGGPSKACTRGPEVVMCLVSNTCLEINSKIVHKVQHVL